MMRCEMRLYRGHPVIGDGEQCAEPAKYEAWFHAGTVRVRVCVEHALTCRFPKEMHHRAYGLPPAGLVFVDCERLFDIERRVAAATAELSELAAL